MLENLRLKFVGILVIIFGLAIGIVLYIWPDAGTKILPGPEPGTYAVDMPEVHVNDCKTADAVLVMHGGQTPLCAEDVESIQWVVENNYYVVTGFKAQYQGNWITMSASHAQPGPAFNEWIAQVETLPRGLASSAWPQSPTTLYSATDQMIVFTGKDATSNQTVRFSTRVDQAFLWPHIEVRDGIEIVTWSYDSALGELASKWVPLAKFGRGDSADLINADPPHQQISDRTNYPHHYSAIFGGWRVDLILKYADYDTTLGGTNSAGMRYYRSPEDTYYATFVTVDGHQWIPWQLGTKSIIVYGTGWEVKMTVD